MSTAWLRVKDCLEVEANCRCQSLRIEIAVWFQDLAGHSRVKETACHVLVEEYLESISGRKVDVPVVIVEIGTPSQTQLEIEVCSEAKYPLSRDVEGWYPSDECRRGRSWEELRFVLEFIFCIEHIRIGISKEPDALTDIPIGVDACSRTNRPRLVSLEYVHHAGNFNKGTRCIREFRIDVMRMDILCDQS